MKKPIWIKNLVEALADPLVHLVRNSVDHGVEMPDEREKKGKPRVGTVLLSAEQEGDHILLIIQDDGHGMNADVLRRKAVEKGIMDQDAADRLTENECFNLIFAPGFSTKEQISDVSGRGVGMDVVKTKIAQLNGTVVIHLQAGRRNQHSHQSAVNAGDYANADGDAEKIRRLPSRWSVLTRNFPSRPDQNQRGRMARK